MKNKSPLITSYFEMSGTTLKPEECTSFIGIEPTNHGYRKTINEFFWEICIEKKPCYCIDEAINELIDILWSKRHKIKKIIDSKNISASIGSNITIYEDRPLYCLKPSTMQRIIFFNIEYGLDIFDYS